MAFLRTYFLTDFSGRVRELNRFLVRNVGDEVTRL